MKTIRLLLALCVCSAVTGIVVRAEEPKPAAKCEKTEKCAEKAACKDKAACCAEAAKAGKACEKCPPPAKK